MGNEKAYKMGQLNMSIIIMQSKDARKNLYGVHKNISVFTANVLVCPIATGCNKSKGVQDE